LDSGQTRESGGEVPSIIAVLKNVFLTQFSVNLQNNLSSSQKKGDATLF
jgi:hypothetical protein